jgi:hypothetical protein
MQVPQSGMHSTRSAKMMQQGVDFHSSGRDFFAKTSILLPLLHHMAFI